MTRDPSANPRSVDDHAGLIARMLAPLSEEPDAETAPLREPERYRGDAD